MRTILIIIITILVSLLLATSSFASIIDTSQTCKRISDRIVDQLSRTQMEYARVVLFQLADSKEVTGAITD